MNKFMIKFKNKNIFYILLLALSFMIIMPSKSNAFNMIKDDNEDITYGVSNIDDIDESELVLDMPGEYDISSSDNKIYIIENELTKGMLYVYDFAPDIRLDSEHNYKYFNDLSNLNLEEEIKKECAKYNFNYEIKDDTFGYSSMKIDSRDINLYVGENDNYTLGILFYKDKLYAAKCFFKNDAEKIYGEYNFDDKKNEEFYTLYTLFEGLKLDKIEREETIKRIKDYLKNKDSIPEELLDEDKDNFNRTITNIGDNKPNSIYSIAANYLYNKEGIKNAYDSYVKKASGILKINSSNEGTKIELLNNFTLFAITLIWILLMIQILFMINKNNKRIRVKVLFIMTLLYALVMPLIIEFFKQTGYESLKDLYDVYKNGILFLIILGVFVHLGITYGLFIKLKRKNNLLDQDNLHEENDSPYVK
ncbi:MAG: hypothetical protein MJ244_03875 [Clostridia bacterium]|nr:hypothetical protein [Clostridia bacterium]